MHIDANRAVDYRGEVEDAETSRAQLIQADITFKRAHDWAIVVGLST